jgi:hypothetical protein
MLAAGKSPSIQSINQSTMTIALQLLAVQLINMSPGEPLFMAYVSLIRWKMYKWRDSLPRKVTGK